MLRVPRSRLYPSDWIADLRLMIGDYALSMGRCPQGCRTFRNMWAVDGSTMIFWCGDLAAE
jgi:hypothetical protein